MAEKQKPKISYIVSLCGIMCGLALAMMFFLSMIPAFEYISPAVAGLLIWVIKDQLGVKYGLVSYISVGILCLLFTPKLEASMMYVFLLGYYPIIRQFLHKIKSKVLMWIVKLVVYAVPCVLCYLLLIYLFGMAELLEDMGEFGTYGGLVLLAFGAVAFIAYDIFLGLFEPFYEKIMKPKIIKRTK